MDKQRRYFNSGPAGRDFSTLTVTSQYDGNVGLQIDGIGGNTGVCLILTPEQVANLLGFIGDPAAASDPMWEDVTG